MRRRGRDRFRPAVARLLARNVVHDLSPFGVALARRRELAGTWRPRPPIMFLGQSNVRPFEEKRK